MDYKVFLKENNDFETPFLEKDKKYIASLIDHIDIDYKYAFKSNYDMDVICILDHIFLRLHLQKTVLPDNNLLPQYIYVRSLQ